MWLLLDVEMIQSTKNGPVAAKHAFALASALLMAGCTPLGTAAKISVMPLDAADRADQEEWGYSDALVSGDLVYLSGVVAARREDDAGPQAAFERAFAKIAAILDRAGSSWDDIVDITSYHTDVTAQIEPMVAVKTRYVKAPFPAWTAIGVSRLIPPDGIAEIKVVARVSRPNRSGRRLGAGPR
ncbi:MAG TPA: RidA family protein [Allosphingosinicella sp.]|jgi:enamine deaminase RidA (YjgF/YER057c/UK114 family)